MREILFRGKEKDQWVSGYYWKYEQNGKEFHVIRDSADKLLKFNHICDPKTLGQYTGLTDKNGVKIFEGDIIRRKRIDGNWYNYEVFWWENCWGIKGGAEVALLILPLCGLQVIGNIHDNPELLEGAAKMSDAPPEQLGLAPAT